MNTLQTSEKHARHLSTRTLKCFLLVLAATGLQTQIIRAQTVFDGPRWDIRFDVGGTIPQDAELTQFAGPVRGELMRLSPGFQMDLGFNYKITPWLAVGPELGLLFNEVDSFGSYSHHDTSLFQMPLMANVTLQYPVGRFLHYVGGGIGGVASVLTFGEDYYWGPDGTGSDFSLGFQGFAGLNYRFNQGWQMGVIYRYLYTDGMDWNVEWWNDAHFHVAVESVQTHSVCLVLQASF